MAAETEKGRTEKKQNRKRRKVRTGRTKEIEEGYGKKKTKTGLKSKKMHTVNKSKVKEG
jgi:hypothetical protein